MKRAIRSWLTVRPRGGAPLGLLYRLVAPLGLLFRGGAPVGLLLRWVTPLALLLLVPDDAGARVGGGDSYSGSGSSGSSDFGGGGGGGGGDDVIVYLVFRLLLWLCLEHPAVGLPLTAVVVVGALMYSRRRPRGGVSTRRQVPIQQRRPQPQPGAAGIRALKGRDPNFSTPLFMDFCRLLFVRLQQARGAGTTEPLRPYATAPVLAQLQRDGVREVRDVVVGAARIHAVKSAGGEDKIQVFFDANLTEVTNGRATRLFVQELWVLRRKAGVLSKAPEDIMALQCPNCGNSAALTPQGQCTACESVVTHGEFHWQVQTRTVLTKHPPTQVAVGRSGGGKEHGLDFPTVYQPNFAVARKEFGLRYPEFSWAAFQARVEETFHALNQAWSSKRWEQARPYETDPLFDSHRFWMERYRQSGLTNVVENIQILRMEPCKIERDAFFDLITVRVFARMIDYTVRDDGTVVSGSKSVPREFSEYWTFLRRAGFVGSRATDAGACPSCGAPLSINRAGQCEYCDALITSGRFDWVLSAIDQDEDYAG